MLPLLAVIVGVVVCGRQATLDVKPTQHPEKLKLRENPNSQKAGRVEESIPRAEWYFAPEGSPRNAIYSLTRWSPGLIKKPR